MDVEALRRAADLALGPHGDPRARAAIEIARIEVTLDVRAWEGSEGEVHAHRVVLELDPATLGALHASPAAHDALIEAFAAGLSETPGHTLEALDVEWGFTVGARTAYRGDVHGDADRDDVEAVRRAANAFLAAATDDDRDLTLDAVTKCALSLSGTAAKIVVPRAAAATVERLRECFASLLRVPVVVEATADDD